MTVPTQAALAEERQRVYLVRRALAEDARCDCNDCIEETIVEGEGPHD